jgi:phosphatidylserine decarboxylase
MNFATKSGSGQLIVEIMGGRNLAAKDKGGTSDPYCIIKIGDQERRTDIIYKTLNPEWFQEFFM